MLLAGFPEEWIGKTFALCAVWNGATAIVAGVLAQIAADLRGDIGPFQLAICLTILAGVLLAPWEENYGHHGDIDGGEGGRGEGDRGKGGRSPLSLDDVSAFTVPMLRAALKERGLPSSGVKAVLVARLRGALAPSGGSGSGGMDGSGVGGGGKESGGEESVEGGFFAAWRAVRSDRALLAVGAMYALFEGAMYTFVFNWVPTLASALGGFEQIGPERAVAKAGGLRAAAQRSTARRARRSCGHEARRRNKKCIFFIQKNTLTLAY